MVRQRNAIVCAYGILAAWALLACPADAADRSADLASALRERGWDDVVVDFLEWVGKSPLASAEFSQRLPWERATALARQAEKSTQRDQQRRLQLASAQEFEAYAAAHRLSVEAVQAWREAANLYASVAFAALDGAERLPPQANGQQQTMRDAAREYFDLALSTLDRLLESSGAQLAAFPKAALLQADPEAKSQRDQLRNLNAEGEFTQALLTFERARSFPREASGFLEGLNHAVEGFTRLHKEYRDTLVGSSSRFYQGRCLQEQGEYEKAIACYQDLTGQPVANEDFRRWTARAHRHRMECLISLGKQDQAIRSGEAWWREARPSERELPEWLGVAFLLAEQYADQYQQSKPGASDAKKLLTATRSLLRDVAKTPNEFQSPARRALARLNQATGSTVDAEEFTSFDAAIEAGKSAFEQLSSTQLASRLAEENNPDAVPELASQAAMHKSQAMAAFERAAELTDGQTPPDQLATLRYYLCWLYWEEERLPEAAVLGGHIAERYPESPHALGGAKVALAAYEQLIRQARQEGNNADYETRRLGALARIIAERWPHSPEAATSAHLLIKLAMEGGRHDEAEQLLDQLPSEARAVAQLTLGSALWSQSLEAISVGHEEEVEGIGADANRTAAALRDKARPLLEQGYDGVRGAGVEPSVASAIGVLYLAQLRLAAGDWQGAESVLEDPQVGPLAMAQGATLAAEHPDFVLEAYKTGLRVYLTSEPPRRQEAEAMMKALEKEAGADSSQLTKVYLSLGLQLQQQVQSLTASGKTNQAKEVAEAFADLLERVAQQDDAQSWTVQKWLAQSNLQLGAGLQGADAKKFIDRAEQIYLQILHRAQQDAKFAPDGNSLWGIRKQLADCLVASDQADQAYAQYVALLHEMPKALALQEAAAEALLQWGLAKHDTSRVEQAIRGSERQENGANLVWGWLKMSQIADGQRSKLRAAKTSAADPRLQQFDDLFFKSRFRIAKARFLAASAAPTEGRAKQLSAALASVETMFSLYPDMGGSKWKAAFEQLRNQVQEASN